MTALPLSASNQLARRVTEDLRRQLLHNGALLWLLMSQRLFPNEVE